MDNWQALANFYGWRTRDALGIADEATAFLEGRLLGLVQASGKSAPPWLWLNALAHADHERLREIAATPAALSETMSDWSSARSALARQLLDLTSGVPEKIEQMQRQVLVPLEGRLGAVAGLTPDLLFQIVTQEMWFVAR